MDTEDSSTPRWIAVMLVAILVVLAFVAGDIHGYDRGYQDATVKASQLNQNTVVCTTMFDWSVYWPSAWQTGERYVAPLPPVKKINLRDIPPPEAGAGTNNGPVLPPC